MNKEINETTVLVTGASGYIATHCILQLLQEGYSVRGTLRTPRREQNLRKAFARHVDAENRLSFVTADLTSDSGWREAVRDCRYVLHIASPNLAVEPKDENAWIAPARDGTLRVLRAAAAAGVERVVLTSSVAAVCRGRETEGKVFTEADWSNLDTELGAYARSKTVAELAAWEFVDTLPADNKLELAAINPSYVIGPLLDEDKPTSVEIVGKLLRREVPGCVRLGFQLVDVRDVASAHLAAMTEPQAAGKRFICNTEFYWSQEIAYILEEQFGDRGYRIPTRMLPNIVMYLVAIFDESIRRLLPDLGLKVELSNDLMRNTLNWQPRPVEESIVDTAESLIEFDV
jgi:dihydroflavonol-4-reductase